MGVVEHSEFFHLNFIPLVAVTTAHPARGRGHFAEALFAVKEAAAAAAAAASWRSRRLIGVALSTPPPPPYTLPHSSSTTAPGVALRPWIG